MRVILATQDAEIRRITVSSQPRANSSRDSFLKIVITKKGWWSGSRCRTWVQTQYHKTKNKQKTTLNLKHIKRQNLVNHTTWCWKSFNTTKASFIHILIPKELPSLQILFMETNFLFNRNVKKIKLGFISGYSILRRLLFFFF
jgi:hypothetical protein